MTNKVQHIPITSRNYQGPANTHEMSHTVSGFSSKALRRRIIDSDVCHQLTIVDAHKGRPNKCPLLVVDHGRRRADKGRKLVLAIQVSQDGGFPVQFYLIL